MKTKLARSRTKSKRRGTEVARRLLAPPKKIVKRAYRVELWLRDPEVKLFESHIDLEPEDGMRELTGKTIASIWEAIAARVTSAEERRIMTGATDQQTLERMRRIAEFSRKAREGKVSEEEIQKEISFMAFDTVPNKINENL